MQESIFPIRIYYDDTDAVGIVYHGNYLKFFERARSDWILSMGYDGEAIKKYDALFVVRSVELDFIKPAKLYDQLQIITTIQEIKKATVIFSQVAKSAVDSDVIYCQAIVKVVCVNHQFKPRAVPEILKEEMVRDS